MSPQNAPSQDRDTDSVLEIPSPPPWAFESVYSQSLPATFQFDPQTGFVAMLDYMGSRSQGLSANELTRVNPLFATYRDGTSKRAWTRMPGLSPEEKEEYIRGATISGATKH
jgi:hypothetical protein